LDALPKASKCNQDYFIDNILPVLNQAKNGNNYHKIGSNLIMHMDNSIYHNGIKITEKISSKRLGQALHSICSPDISLCDFWVFQTIQEMIKSQHLIGPVEILRVIDEAQSHFTFEDFQNIFKSWMK
jgi:hypothetical protein